MAEETDAVSRVFNDSKAPALGAAVFDAERTLYLQAAGLRRRGSAEAVTNADQWHLGSNTKAMTALVYRRLEAEGRIAADAPLKDLLSGIEMPDVVAACTASDLMAHRAGLSDTSVIDTAWLIGARADARPLPEQRRAIAARALARSSTSPEPPFEYANINFITLGAIMEQATGQTWEALMQEHLFGPLGMSSAGFGAPRGDQPWGHDDTGAVDPANPLSDNPAALGPAGTVHMALEDYGRFLRLFLTSGSDVVSPQVISRIVDNPLPGDQTYRDGWIVFGHRGWAEGPVLAHEGSNTLWHAIALAAPRRKLAIVAVSNSETSGAAATQQLALALIEKFAPV
jgi:CubicO group peptidase (beta-lactamase class C family)